MLLLFDFDGTIADTAPGVLASMRYALETMGYTSPPDEILRLFMGPPLAYSMRKHVHVKESDIDRGIELFRERYDGGEKFNCAPFPGIVDAFRAFREKGHHLGIVSAKPEYFVRQIAAHLQIDMLFDVIAGASMEEKEASKAENIERALRETGYSMRREEVRMIGDRKYDIEGAKACGVPSVGILYGYGSEEELVEAGADEIYRTVEELRDHYLSLMAAGQADGGRMAPLQQGSGQMLPLQQESGQWNRPGRIPHSAGGKVWEILYPGLILLGCSLIAGAIVGFVVGLKASATGNMHSVMDEILSASLLSSLVGFLLVVFVQMIFLRYDDRRFGKQQNRWNGGQIVLGVAVAIMAGLVGNYLIGISPLPEMFPAYSEIAEITFTNQHPVVMLLAIAIVGPIAEEITFRGLTQRRAVLYTKPWIGILISSLIFGAYHLNMVQFIYAFPLGILLGYMYYKSDNLLVPILAHMAANAAALFYA